MFKKLVLFTLVLCMFVATPLAAYDGFMVTPQSSAAFICWGAGIWDNGTNILCETFSDLCDEYTTSITMQLQKYNGTSWVTLKSWYTSTYDNSLSILKTYPCSPGVYRVKGTHKAGGETKTSYSPNYKVWD